MKKIFALTYHSQMISGMDYACNDHVSLQEDLRLLRALKFRCIRATALVRALREGRFDSLPERCVVITFDDGPVFDVERTEFPPFGVQEPMESLLRRAGRPRWLRPWAEPDFPATSFVIAGADARRQIAASMGNDQWMSEHWWAPAQRRGLLDIGAHSWTHVHPIVEEMADRRHLVEAFHLIDDAGDAEREIAQSVRYVHARTGHAAARLFAYPYGQYNGFLTGEYLPQQQEAAAAFTIDGRPVTAQSSVWAIPRYAVHHHWKTPEALQALLRD